MQLLELLKRVEQWNDDDTTIYVEPPWSPDAEAILVTPAPETTEPIERDDRRYHYFLETIIAREFLDGFTASDGGSAASEKQRCERLISYAENDA